STGNTGRTLQESALVHAPSELGMRTVGVVASPLPGPSGNVEYFLWLRNDGSFADDGERVAALVERAVEEGPQ
ncbi:16S/23S rRNA (cytidine-2'-O)-methyltransferase, partial [Nocardia niwae]